MEDQLEKNASVLVNTAIEKAVDKITIENEEMAKGFDQGIDDIIGLTIGRSITAIRDGQTSPTDNEMKELVGHLDKGVDDIVDLTIGRSITAIREGKGSPTGNKMEDLLGLNNSLATITTPEVATATAGSKSLEISDAGFKPSVKGTGSDQQPEVVTSDLVKDAVPTGLKNEHVTTHQLSKASGKRNVLERLLDKVFKVKRDKKEVKEIDATTAGGSSIASSKAHNKRDWIRRNLLCCFV